MISSSHEFIRALKAALDPPQPGGLTKIEIASQVWSNEAFYVPEKGKVIVEWIFSCFTKDKSSQLSNTSLLDLRYWSLLHLIFSSLAHEKPSTSGSWLDSVLGRLSIGPIVTSFFLWHDKLPQESWMRLVSTASQCLSMIWTIPAQKMSSDAILDCLAAFLSSSAANTQDSTTGIGLAITTTYRHSLANNANKKKLYSHFMQSILPTWLVFLLSTSPDNVRDAVYESGVETFFSVDVLRQSRDFSHGGSFFKHLSDRCNGEQLSRLLPRLYCSFLNRTRRHRGALYGQSSTPLTGAEGLVTGGIQFLSAALEVINAISDPQAVWLARVGLMQTAERENVFRSTSAEANILLSKVVAQIIDALSNKSENPESRAHVIECLLVVSRIDCTQLTPSPQILFLLLPDRSQAISDFLDTLLSYHSKIRTLDVYISALLTAVHTSTLDAARQSAVNIYASASEGALLQPTHLYKISAAIRMFLTPAQVDSIVKEVFTDIRTLWESFYDLHKKRESKNQHDQDIQAVSLSLTLKLAATILAATPLRSLTGEAASGLSQLLQETRVSLLEHALDRGLKSIKKAKEDGSWSMQVVSAALLELQYAMDSAHPPLYSCVQARSLKMIDRLLGTKLDEVVSELVLNISRALLHNLVIDSGVGAPEVFDMVLRFIENASAPNSTSSVTADGVHIPAALVLLHMITRNWIAVAETYGSESHLERYVGLLLNQRLGESSSLRPATYGHAVLMQSLHSAHFWEMPRLRTIFLSLINDVTIPLEDAESIVQTGGGQKLLDSINIYKLILAIPIDYLSKTLRTDLTKRAISADIALHASLQDDDHNRHLAIVLRQFLKRACQSSGFPSKPYSASDFAEHLIKPPITGVALNHDYTSSTLELVEVLLLGSWRDASKGDLEALRPILQMYIVHEYLNKDNSLYLQALIKFIGIVIAGPSQSSLPNSLTGLLQNVFQTQSSSILPRVNKGIFSINDLGDGFQSLVATWRSLLELGAWLGLLGPSSPSIGLRLIMGLAKLGLSSPHKFCDLTFAHAVGVMFQEVAFCPERALELHWYMLTGACVSGKLQTEEARHQMYRYISAFCKATEVVHYASLLDQITALLAEKPLQPSTDPFGRFIRLTNLATLALSDHPQGSLKEVQRFASQSINNFTMREMFTKGPQELRSEVLEFTLRHCSDRPSSLRSIDLSAILALVTKMLCPSTTHDSTTSTTIFHKIIGILSAIIRLRRDLVIHTLPHLGLILRRLIFLVRSCRPNLGGKQMKLVMDTQPQWLAPEQPLEQEEAKALSRLLEGLAVKTVPRAHLSTTEPQKAESLAKAFSRHAAYVLKAYIDVMNDPLCLLSSATRKQMAPGLYALCGMMNEHSRDALMISGLDGGGKATLKSLWKDYEKQRYAGQG